jgi:hypothetical protein
MSKNFKTIVETYVEKYKPIEHVFGDRMSERGVVIYADKKQDIQEHWDVQVNDIKYDVKGLKKVLRSDVNENENIHWIELKNVIGKLGWLYSGLSTHLCFETNDYWVIVSKIKLQEFIAEKCKGKEVANFPTLYKFYTRKDRQDIITLVKTIDLMYLADEILIKQ